MLVTLSFSVLPLASWLGLETVPYGHHTWSKGICHENQVNTFLRKVIRQSTHMFVITDYNIGALDTHNVTIIVFSKVCVMTPLGYLPVGDVKMLLNVTMNYGPEAS